MPARNKKYDTGKSRVKADKNLLGMQAEFPHRGNHLLHTLLAPKVDFRPHLFHLLGRLDARREIEHPELAVSRAIESPMNLSIVEGRFSQRPLDYPAIENEVS